MANSNISGGKIEVCLKQWICDTPFIRSILTNPFTVSILILTIVWLLDLLYGKTFEAGSTREIIQHSTTVLFVMIAGIFLNNLALTKCDKISSDKISGACEEPSQVSCKEIEYDATEPISPANKYDEVLSRYE
jgi:hypothetical protein